MRYRRIFLPTQKQAEQWSAFIIWGDLLGVEVPVRPATISEREMADWIPHPVVRLPRAVADAVVLWNKGAVDDIRATYRRDSRLALARSVGLSVSAYAPMTKRQYLDEVVLGALAVDLDREAQALQRLVRRAWPCR